MTVSIQDPPNGALECKVNGVATTTVITITAPVLMTDESGAMTLDYDVELVGMTRGGPTVFNTTASAETVDEKELVCDEGSGVSLYIDSVTSTSCPSPMFSSYLQALYGQPNPLPQGICYMRVLSGSACASCYEEMGPVGNPQNDVFACRPAP